LIIVIKKKKKNPHEEHHGRGHGLLQGLGAAQHVRRRLRRLPQRHPGQQAQLHQVLLQVCAAAARPGVQRQLVRLHER